MRLIRPFTPIHLSVNVRSIRPLKSPKGCTDLLLGAPVTTPTTAAAAAAN
jgi:hypothetical protein